MKDNTEYTENTENTRSTLNSENYEVTESTGNPEESAASVISADSENSIGTEVLSDPEIPAEQEVLAEPAVPTESEPPAEPAIPGESEETDLTVEPADNEEGYYNIALSDEEADAEAAAAQHNTRLSAVLIAAFALLGVIAVIIVLIAVLKTNDNDDGTTDMTTSSSVSSASATSSSSESAAAGITPSSETSDDPESSDPIDYTDYGVSVSLGDYKSISMNVTTPEVTEEEVEEKITSFMNGFQDLREVTGRPAQLGDTVIIDYDGLVEGERHKGTTGTDFSVKIGSGRTIKGFEDGIAGMQIGESKVLNLEFPDPYYTDTELSGKPVDFTITLKKIQEDYIPELTDEFISENTDCKTVQEYRESTKASIFSSKESQAYSKAFEEAVSALVDACTFSPEVENEISDRMEYYREYYDRYFTQNFGVDALTYSSLTQEEYDGMLHKISESEVKAPYVYQEIARAEGYSPTDQERTDKFNELFYDMYGFENEEEIYKTFTKRMCDISVEMDLYASYGYHWLRDKLGMPEA